MVVGVKTTPTMDDQKYITALTSMEAKLTDVGNHGNTIVEELIGDEDFGTSEGISLLEVKNHLLLDYNVAVAVVCLMKIEGQDISQHPVVDHLSYLRTALEKVKSVEAKLKYQIDKLVRIASDDVLTAVSNATDPLKFKPSVENLEAKSGYVDSDTHGSDKTGSHKDGVYQPPKMTAAFYEEDNSKVGRRMRQEAKNRAKMADSDMMKDLRAEFSDRPEEISHNEFSSAAVAREIKEREDVEENHFVRLGGRKKLLKKRKQLTSSLVGVSAFDVTKGLRGLEDAPVQKSMSQKMDERKRARLGGKKR
eukprot:m.259541 g.259541  ORF g.259541 m.259541 type:complete len:307 (+) comp38232_c0_seq1:151-1071(+)